MQLKIALLNAQDENDALKSQLQMQSIELKEMRKEKRKKRRAIDERKNVHKQQYHECKYQKKKSFPLIFVSNDSE